VLTEMRAPEREVFYLVGTPRGKIQQYEKKWLELPWRKVRDSVEVKLFAEEGELYVLAKSAGRRPKEQAIRRRKLVRLLWKLRDLRRKAPARDQLLLRIGAAKKEAGGPSVSCAFSCPRRAKLSRARPSRSNWTKTSCRRPNSVTGTICCGRT